MVRLKMAPLLLTGFAVLALLLLPPRPYPEPGPQDGAVKQLWHALLLSDNVWQLNDNWILRNRLERTSAALGARVRAATIADAIHADAARRGIRSSSGRITLVSDERLSADETVALLSSMEDELDRLPGGAHEGAPITVTLGDRSPSTHGIERFAPLQDGRSGCHVVVEPGFAGVPRTDAGDPDGAALLGACALYGRYGMPGSAGVWLGARRLWWEDAASELVQAAAAGGVSSVLSGAWRADGCRRGVAAHCILLASRSEGPSWMESRYSNVGQLRQHLGFYLLATRGGEAFGRAWRSDLPPAEALAAAYGTDLAALVSEYTQHWVTERQYGPRFKASAGFTSLGWVLLLGLLASVAVARRRGG